jgi:hypothetical protein
MPILVALAAINLLCILNQCSLLCPDSPLVQMKFESATSGINVMNETSRFLFVYRFMYQLRIHCRILQNRIYTLTRKYVGNTVTCVSSEEGQMRSSFVFFNAVKWEMEGLEKT